MKNIHRWIAALFALIIPLGQFLSTPMPVSAQEPGCRSVREALDAREITLVLSANESSFYDEPLTFNVENISGSQVEFCFPAGMIMISDSGSYQNLILTKTVFVTLASGEHKEGRLSANCGNLNKDAPLSGASFQPGPMAEGDVLGVIQAIDRNSAQGSLGAQLALWAVTDGLALDGMGSGSDSDSAAMFRTIAPILCLTREELVLGQRLLEEANADVRLFEGDSQSGMQFCEALGFPTDINQVALLVGRYSVITLCCCGGGCGLLLIVLVGGIVLVVRSRKH